jgi:hypothetical protein
VRQRHGPGQQIWPREQRRAAGLAALQKAEIDKWWPIIGICEVKADSPRLQGRRGILTDARLRRRPTRPRIVGSANMVIDTCDPQVDAGQTSPSFRHANRVAQSAGIYLG